MKISMLVFAIVGLGVPVFAQPVPQTSANPDQPNSSAPPTVQFTSDLYKVNKNESGSAIIAVKRSGTADGEVTVTYSSKGGTAAAGSDYTSTTGELKFASGETRKTFPVPIMETPGQDATTVNLELSDPRNAVLGKPSKAVLSIAPVSSAGIMGPVKWRVLKHIGVFLSVLGLVLLGGYIAIREANRQAAKWVASLLKNSDRQLAFGTNTAANKEQQSRMQVQLDTIRGRVEHHTDVMAYFYKNYYMSIVTFSIAAAIAAVALVMVSQNGWQSANEYIVNIFFTSTAVSAFFGSFPAVFQQQKNITDNKMLCVKFLSLENEVLSYGVTDEGLNYDVTNINKASAGADAAASKPKLGIPLRPEDFLHYVDLQLSQDTVAIGFDYQKVANYKNALDVK